MAKAQNQKLKLLYMIRLLAASDAEHVTTMSEIIDELNANGIAAERKSIYDDINALRAFGFEIEVKRSRPVGYYLKDRGAAAGLLGIYAECAAADKSGSAARPAPAAEEGPAAKEKAQLPAWAGGKVKVELRMSERSARELEELLGKDVSVKCKEDEKHGVSVMTARFRAEPGDAFYGWVASQGRAVQITAPEQVIKGYKKYLKELRGMYKGD